MGALTDKTITRPHMEIVLLSRDFSTLFFPQFSSEQVSTLVECLFPGATVGGLETYFNSYMDLLRLERYSNENKWGAPIIVSACPRVRQFIVRYFPATTNRLSKTLAPAKVALQDLLRTSFSFDQAQKIPAPIIDVFFVSPCLAKAKALRKYSNKYIKPDFPGLQLHDYHAVRLARRIRKLMKKGIPHFIDQQQLANHIPTNFPPDVLVCHGRSSLQKILCGKSTIAPSVSIILPYWCSGGCSGRPAK